MPIKETVPTCDTRHQASEDIKNQLGEGGSALLTLSEGQKMADFFAVLADPTRLRLISLLSEKESCVCDLAQGLALSESAVSHQLRALRQARLVRYRKEGRRVFYALDDHHIFELYSTVREHLSHS